MFVKLTLDGQLLRRAKPTKYNAHGGTFSYIAHNEALSAELYRLYGRTGLCLKIFAPLKYGREVTTSLAWEGVPIEETVKVQNLFARYGLAPRVYDLAWINEDSLAMVTDYLKGDGQPARWSERIGLADLLIETHKIGSKKQICPSGEQKWDLDFGCNWLEGKFIDFGGYYFADPQSYFETLQHRAYTLIATDHKGEIGTKAYQALGALGVVGERNMGERILALGLAEEDFGGKTVLDIGCNLGEFCRYASDRGAQRMVGVDRAFITGNVREIDNWLGYWRTDYLGLKLSGAWPNIVRHTGIEKFDIVFCLSVVDHIGGYAPWITGLCRRVLYFEGHAGIPREPYEETLSGEFAQVRFLGYSTDAGQRALFRCEVE